MLKKEQKIVLKKFNEFKVKVNRKKYKKYLIEHEKLIRSLHIRYVKLK